MTTPYKILQDNKQKVIEFSDDYIRTNTPPESLKFTHSDIVDKIKNNNFAEAIRMFDQIKDSKLGIVWSQSDDLGNGTKALVRDARNVTLDKEKLKEDAPEKYAMQILNQVRASIDLINIEKKYYPFEKTPIEKGLMDFAIKACDPNTIQTLPKTIKKHNYELIKLLENAGIKDVEKKLKFAKEVQNLKDEHFHIVTLTKAKDKDGKDYVVTEADIMLNGLTDTQKEQWKGIKDTKGTSYPTDVKGENMSWYNKMPDYKKILLRQVADYILTGNKVIPTQLISDVPGIKNAYQKVTAITVIKEEGNIEPSKIISENLHCGTPATKIKLGTKDEQLKIVKENIEQLQLFSNGKINLNILTSKTPFDIRGENFINNQLESAIRGNNDVSISALPINRWRLLPGSGKKYQAFKDSLKNISSALKQHDEYKTKYQDIAIFLKKGGSIFNSNEKNARKQLEKLDKKSLEYKFLEQAVTARSLMSGFDFLKRGNTNLKISAAMNNVYNYINLNSEIRDKLSPEKTQVTFCKSGKDRTGLVLINNTHEAVSNYLGIDPESEVAKNNLIVLGAGGHTGQIAGTQGGTPGCHTLKVNPEFGLPKEYDGVKWIINQDSAKYNKLKIEKPSFFSRISNFFSRINNFFTTKKLTRIEDKKFVNPAIQKDQDLWTTENTSLNPSKNQVNQNLFLTNSKLKHKLKQSGRRLLINIRQDGKEYTHNLKMYDNYIDSYIEVPNVKTNNGKNGIQVL
jgi:hypothetical protein